MLYICQQKNSTDIETSLLFLLLSFRNVNFRLWKWENFHQSCAYPSPLHTPPWPKEAKLFHFLKTTHQLNQKAFSEFFPWSQIPSTISLPLLLSTYVTYTTAQNCASSLLEPCSSWPYLTWELILRADLRFPQLLNPNLHFNKSTVNQMHNKVWEVLLYKDCRCLHK